MKRPETRYAAVGDACVAYQVFGQGPHDLLLFRGLGTHIDLGWLSPELSSFLRRLASFSRVIMFDRRGTGASDGVPLDAIPTWEDLAEDVGAVLDAAESERATIYAVAEAGPMALLFAATHPDRVTGLVLVNTYARYMADDDYPEGIAPSAIEAITELTRAKWGTREVALLVNPSRSGDDEFVERLAMEFRASATPRSAAAQYDYLLRRLDARRVLDILQVPTLVLHVRDHPLFPIDQGRYLAEHIAPRS